MLLFLSKLGRFCLSCPKSTPCLQGTLLTGDDLKRNNSKSSSSQSGLQPLMGLSDGVLLHAAVEWSPWPGWVCLSQLQSLRTGFSVQQGNTPQANQGHLPLQGCMGPLPAGGEKRSWQPQWRDWATCFVSGRTQRTEMQQPTTTAVSVWGVMPGLAFTQ